MGNGQHARSKEAQRGDQREKMPKGTASTARAKGGVEGWRTQTTGRTTERTHRGRGEGRASTSTSTSTGAPHSGRELKVGNNPNSGRYSRDIKKPRTRTKKGARDWTRTHVGMSKRLDLHIRTGKHGPSSCTYDKGHRSYEHQDVDTKMNK
jgi:hypothetical protein